MDIQLKPRALSLRRRVDIEGNDGYVLWPRDAMPVDGGTSGARDELTPRAITLKPRELHVRRRVLADDKSSW